MAISGISGISSARRLDCKKCKNHHDVIEAYLIRLKTTFVRVSSYHKQAEHLAAA